MAVDRIVAGDTPKGSVLQVAELAGVMGGKKTAVPDTTGKPVVTTNDADAEKAIGREEAEAMEKRFHAHLDKEFEAAAGYKPNKADWLEGRWSGMERAKGEARRGQTPVKLYLVR